MSRSAYEFIEPFTIANVNGRTPLTFLIYGLDLKFQKSEISVAGVDFKGELFQDIDTPANKYLIVDGLLKRVSTLRFDTLLLLFVIRFDPTGGRMHVGKMRPLLGGDPQNHHFREGVIWTHLDQAVLRDPEGLRAFATGTAAEEVVAYLIAEPGDGDGATGLTSEILDCAQALKTKIQSVRWKNKLPLLESLTWLLFQLMLQYSEVADKQPDRKPDFYWDNAGRGIVQAIRELAMELFAAWDGMRIRGDFGA